MIEETNLTEDQLMIADTAKQIGKRFPYSYFLEKMKAEQFPDDFWQTLAEGGYLGITASQDHGGGDLAALDASIFVRSLAKGAMSSLFLINHISCIDTIDKLASDGQKASLIPAMVKGDRCALADTERTDGVSLTFVQCTAKKDGHGYKLTGTKRYVAGAPRTSCSRPVPAATARSARRESACASFRRT